MSGVVGPRLSSLIFPEFIILVKTDNAGTSASDQFTIPVYTLFVTNNYDVDWGDGNTDKGVSTSITHTYASAGIYTIKISGLHQIYFNGGGDRLKLLEIQNWGDRGGSLWQGLRNRFWACENMEITATDSLIFTGTNGSTQQAFRDCTNMVGNASMNTWDVLAVSDWVNTFRNCTNFNSPIGNWDMSGATTLQSMLQECTNFNQDISSWNVQNNTNFSATLADCTNFNQDISSWNVQNVTAFNSMFARASSFNQNLGAWNLRIAGTNLSSIFFQSGMSTANYTDTIVSWANYVFVNGGPLNTNMSNQSLMTFDTSRSGGANFANAGDARTYLTTATPTGAGWTISSDTVI